MLAALRSSKKAGLKSCSRDPKGKNAWLHKAPGQVGLKENQRINPMQSKFALAEGVTPAG
jgi:hypothetical protein